MRLRYPRVRTAMRRESAHAEVVHDQPDQAGYHREGDDEDRHHRDDDPPALEPQPARRGGRSAGEAGKAGERSTPGRRGPVLTATRGEITRLVPGVAGDRPE